MSHKRDRPPGGIPLNKKDKPSKLTGTTKDTPAMPSETDNLCISCDKLIEENGILCECCYQWEHFKCVGISDEEYNILGNSSPSIMFFCTVCRPKATMALKFFNDLQDQQNILNAKVAKLENELGELNNCLKSHKETSSVPKNIQDSLDKRLHHLENKLSEPVLTPQNISNSQNTSSSSTTASDRKFNIVVYGLPESPPNTDKRSRQKHDMEVLLKSLVELDSEINPSVFKDFYRLGKYQINNSRPRPLLVKFLRSADVAFILSNKSKLKSKVYLKPDLTPDQRSKESLLLKERRSLIEKGTERKQIKIRNYSIFVNNLLYCKVVGTQLEFQSSQSSNDIVANNNTSSSN